MPKSDWELFNCYEEHEIRYVVGLYPGYRPDEVREAIMDLCRTYNNMTHEFIYKKLRDKGFQKA